MCTSWASRGDVVYIESRCSGSLGGRGAPVTFAVCDRVRLDDARIAERHSYYDPLPLLLAILRRPDVWPRALATLIGS